MRNAGSAWISLGAAVGFVYGLLLMLGSFTCAAFGHGSYLPFAMCAAPLSLIPVVGFFAAPVWWSVLGGLSGQRRPWIYVALLILHAASVVLIASRGSPMEPGDEIWRYFWEAERRIPAAIWGTIGLYVGGQGIAWIAALARFASADGR